MSEVTIETLLEEARITRVLNRYASALDAKDWAGLDEVFTVDATAHFQGIGHYKGRAAIAGLITSVLSSTAATQHLIANVQIEVKGNDAQAKCYLQALHTGKGAYENKSMTVWGEYRDHLKLLPEGWRIVHRELAGIHAEGDIGMPIIRND